MVWVLFSSSAVNVYDSQAYRKMDRIREHISFTFGPTDMSLPLRLMVPVLSFSSPTSDRRLDMEHNTDLNGP